MHRQILVECLPFLALIVVCCLVLRGLIALSHVRPDFRQLRKLHRDQAGAVQSLSFVLTLPLFIIVLMFIVQLSQLTIAKVLVEYAAYSATRAAIVWLPANVGAGMEAENQFMGGWQMSGMYQSPNGGPTFSVYQISPGGMKYGKIQLAAAMALMPICPSSNIGAGVAGNPQMPALASIQNVYAMIAPSSTANPKINQRLSNKLAYAINNTQINVLVRHREDEPILQNYPHLCTDLFPFYPGDLFQNGEYGWQDQILVTVQHNFALLPGPARILARRANAPVGSDPKANSSIYIQNGTIVNQTPSLYVYPMSATVRFNNEGERSRMTYYQPLAGMAPQLPASLPLDPAGNSTGGNLPGGSNPFGFVGADGTQVAPCLNCKPTGESSP